MVKGAQLFDPEWAQSITHDPDRPLQPDMPDLTVDFTQAMKTCGYGAPVQHEMLKHNEKLRPPELRDSGSQPPSRTRIAVTLKLASSGAEMSFPAETATTVGEVAMMLGQKFGVDDERLTFTRKQGCAWRQMSRLDQVAPKMTLRGMTSFTRHRETYKHVKCIIGAGHLGLKSAMRFLDLGDTDFVVIDRMDRVGGTSWMYQANCTSKLQTEYGAYHLEYSPWSPIPKMFTSPWPSRNALLEHFHKVCEDYGVLPYCKLSTNVKSMEPCKVDRPDKPWKQFEKYKLTLEKVSEGRLQYGKFVERTDGSRADEEVLDVASIFLYPGNLTLPRQEVYKGEELFEGEIGYGMFNEIDYRKVSGHDVTIVGHGAFAVENVRTCCEFDCNKVFLVCRRKNISCPRAVSWLCNRTLNPPTCAVFLKWMEPMYKMANFDVWDYYAVQANADRTRCQIIQKARFGIGDIYFLSIYMGKLEVIVDTGGVKRLTKHCVHLSNGRKIECRGILKLLGLLGELDNDRLMGIKELVGFWVNGDCRRYLVAEPVSVMATSMGGTSFSPGAWSWSNQGIYMLFYPWEFYNAMTNGVPLPRHEADMSDPGTPRPAYVVDARHGTSTGMAIGGNFPMLNASAEFGQWDGLIKALRQRLCHPVRKFLAQAKEDWDHYAERFLKEGFGTDKPYPEYPYNFDNTKAYILRHMEEMGEPMLPCDPEDLDINSNTTAAVTENDLNQMKMLAERNR
mmetsp:Transcript_12349/g.28995  ORF Transcript_12349/g.28995 Transcript_12349/m.28995 type:complete len:733 (+) Transcript_12349:83-2281(+)